MRNDLTETEVFYFASLIHLRFVHIHPFRDGNGRVARLLEKWFITEKLGQKFWEIPSEEYYKKHQREYYSNINLGVNFYELNYDNCLPFLEMLPKSLKQNNYNKRNKKMRIYNFKIQIINKLSIKRKY